MLSTKINLTIIEYKIIATLPSLLHLADEQKLVYLSTVKPSNLLRLIKQGTFRETHSAPCASVSFYLLVEAHKLSLIMI